MQRIPQVACAFRVALDVKDPGTRPDPKGLREDIVLYDLIAFGGHLDFDCVGALPLEWRSEEDFILARPKRRLLLRKRTTVQLHLDARRTLGARNHPHPHCRRLLLPHAFGQIDRFDPGVVFDRRRSR